MLNTEIIILLITNIVAPIITGSVTWMQAKKKYNVEIDSNIINNMKESLNFYKQLSDDNKERLKEVLEKNDYLEKDIMELRKQVLNLTMHICLDLTCKHRAIEKEEVEDSRYKD